MERCNRGTLESNCIDLSRNDVRAGDLCRGSVARLGSEALTIWKECSPGSAAAEETKTSCPGAETTSAAHSAGRIRGHGPIDLGPSRAGLHHAARRTIILMSTNEVQS